MTTPKTLEWPGRGIIPLESEFKERTNYLLMTEAGSCQIARAADGTWQAQVIDSEGRRGVGYGTTSAEAMTAVDDSLAKPCEYELRAQRLEALASQFKALAAAVEAL